MISDNGKKVTAKQWAAIQLLQDLELATTGYYDREQDAWEAMTEKEQAAVSAQFDKFHGRFLKIIMHAYRKGKG